MLYLLFYGLAHTTKSDYNTKLIPSPPTHLVLLFEAVSLGGFHLVDVLQEVGHSDGGVELPRVVQRAFAPALMPRGAPQQAAGLVHQAAGFTCAGDICHWQTSAT